MLRIKQNKLIWFGIIVLGIVLLGMPASIYAQDEPVVNEWVGSSDGEVNYDADSSVPPSVLGSTTGDFVFTPVSPCRIIDTRKVGGPIGSNSYKSFNVHGTVSGQGGNPSGCTAPRGEPRGVVMNIAAVKSIASGHLTVWPYGETRPIAAVINYSPTYRDPISNAFTVKTTYGGSYDISVYAYKQTHVVADVMGYYYDAEPEKIMAVASTGTQRVEYVVGIDYTILVAKTVTIPATGYVILMGEASFYNEGSLGLNCAFFEDTNNIDFWWWDAGDSDTYIDEHQTRFYMKPVTPGTKTYWLKCARIAGTSVKASFRNLTVQFIKEGM